MFSVFIQIYGHFRKSHDVYLQGDHIYSLKRYRQRHTRLKDTARLFDLSKWTWCC